MKKFTPDITLHILLIFPAMLMFFLSNAQSQVDTDTLTEMSPYEENEIAGSLKEDPDADTFEMPDARSDSVAERKFSAGYIDSLKKDKAFGYVKTGIPKPEEQKKNSSRFSLNKAILNIAIIVFTGFLLWYLISNKIILFRRRPASIKDQAEQGELPEDIFSIPYTQAIQKALQEKNYRLAIRLQYLQILKMMSDKKIISYRPDRTNFDYLMQVRLTNYYNDFFNVTRNYEYSWYGLFDISEQQYKKMEQGFVNFHKRLR